MFRQEASRRSAPPGACDLGFQRCQFATRVERLGLGIWFGRPVFFLEGGRHHVGDRTMAQSSVVGNDNNKM